MCRSWWRSWSTSTSPPDLVFPEEQVGGVQLTFYVNYEDRLLAQPILSGVASMLLLVFVGGLRAFLARAEGHDPRWAPVVVAAGLVLLRAAIVVASGEALDYTTPQ